MHFLLHFSLREIGESEHFALRDMKCHCSRFQSCKIGSFSQGCFQENYRLPMWSVFLWFADFTSLFLALLPLVFPVIYAHCPLYKNESWDQVTVLKSQKICGRRKEPRCVSVGVHVQQMRKWHSYDFFSDQGTCVCRSVRAGALNISLYVGKPVDKGPVLCEGNKPYIGGSVMWGAINQPSWVLGHGSLETLCDVCVLPHHF